MTKDVLVSISGLHMDMDAQIPGPDEDDVIEVVTPATYYYRNGKHYIIYDEIVEGVSDTIKNKIKISGTDSLEIMKSGLSNTHMIFEKNKKNLTYIEVRMYFMSIAARWRITIVAINHLLNTWIWINCLH